jgi:hypothetical protein
MEHVCGRRPETTHRQRQDSGSRRIAGIPSANSGVAFGGSEAEKSTNAQRQLNDIGLRAALDQAAGADVFFIVKEHFAKETPEQEDEGRWYRAVSHTVQGVPKM